MNEQDFHDLSNGFAGSLRGMHARVRRRAWLRLALYLWFALASMIAAVVVVDVVSERGVAALASAWPALLAQLAAAVALVAVLRMQVVRLRSLRAMSATLREASAAMSEDAARRRRQSATLIAVVALSVPLLWLAVWRAAEAGVFAPGQALALSLACALPLVVVGLVHGLKLRRLAAEQRWLDGLRQQLQ